MFENNVHSSIAGHKNLYMSAGSILFIVSFKSYKFIPILMPLDLLINRKVYFKISHKDESVPYNFIILYIYKLYNIMEK